MQPTSQRIDIHTYSNFGIFFKTQYVAPSSHFFSNLISTLDFKLKGTEYGLKNFGCERGCIKMAAEKLLISFFQKQLGKSTFQIVHNIGLADTIQTIDC